MLFTSRPSRMACAQQLGPQLVGHFMLDAPPPAWHPPAAAIGQPCIIIAHLSLSAVAQRARVL
jgi:hypothetical protein